MMLSYIQRCFAFAAVLLGCNGISFAQVPRVDAVIQPGSILIGEPARLEVICSFDPLRYGEPQVRMPDSIAHFDVLQSEPVIRATEQNGWALDRHPFQVTSFDSGRWSIPTIEVAFKELSGDSTYITSTPVRWVDVRYAPADTTQPLRALKPLRAAEKPIPWQTYAWWAFGAMLFFTLLAYVLSRYRTRDRINPAAQVMSAEEAYTRALARLDQLVIPDAEDASSVYQWHVDLKQLLRWYFEVTGRTPWVQGTSSDWLVHLAAMEPQTDRGVAASVLRGCDAAMFARYAPDQAAMQLRLQQARTMLRYAHASLTPKPAAA